LATGCRTTAKAHVVTAKLNERADGDRSTHPILNRASSASLQQAEHCFSEKVPSRLW